MGVQTVIFAEGQSSVAFYTHEAGLVCELGAFVEEGGDAITASLLPDGADPIVISVSEGTDTVPVLGVLCDPVTGGLINCGASASS